MIKKLETEHEEYMTFILGGVDYAVSLNKIREILTYPEHVTDVPKTKNFIKGLINLRGEVVPVLDMRIKFNMKNTDYNENTSVIAIKTDDKRMVGIVVDKVNDVQKIDNTQIAPISQLGNSIPEEYLKGFIKIGENEMIVIMDVENVVSKKELN
jgi:purine-binding chemotaxis protein CheW